ncbi:hypothetical protein VTJ04DRAFT_9367 [Mycothermus thermophilus]|uniref:uncharacterized protein n=1 Tax=Humicola insolens TaxID=85995 RepID=UPI0037427205
MGITALVCYRELSSANRGANRSPLRLIIRQYTKPEVNHISTAPTTILIIITSVTGRSKNTALPSFPARAALTIIT